MDAQSAQVRLFERIKRQLPANRSLPEEVASLLGVGTDSIYRRIRGEKLLDLGELLTLAKHFKLSMGGLLEQGGADHLFTGRFVDGTDFTFQAWLSSIIEQLELASEGKDPVFIFQAKDIPLFHHFQVTELAQFKFFFWRKTILRQSSPELVKFDLKHKDEHLLALGR
ncbi:MAG: hypothetical protein JSS77_06540 [Acidobacteria bacterium]|nr:hypothetical protein [Acidobacteriota bacterium]